MEYIGQSKDANKRFKAHSRATDGTLLHQAILTYGIENFEMQILVSQTEDFNELEKFWIKEKNTLYPFGYNMTHGGEGYPHLNGDLCYQAKLNHEQVQEIIKLLRETKMTQEEIGKIFEVRQSIISGINLGKTYFIKTEKYPVRNNQAEYEKIFQQAKELLQNSHCSLSEIADILKIDKGTINEINQGRRYKHLNEEYPLRKVPNSSKLGDPETLKLIKKMLEEETLSMEEIAKIFNVQRLAISHINLGKTHYNKDWIYPLRKQNKKAKNLLSDEVVDKIILELKTTKKSFRQIAKEYNIGSHCTISGINYGKIKAYVRKDVKYPIRQKK